MDFATTLRRLVRGVTRLERDIICCDVTVQQFDTLRLLVEGTQSNTDLARALGIDLSTASRNLAKLEASGYVQRVVSPGDARTAANALTRKGRRCVEGMLEEERDVLGAVLARLPSGRRADARALLAEVAAAVESERKARACTCKNGST
ncbi:MAG: MarR family transcriptional regulator [Myxococcales bacterium]|nr:MarR family transcriptional regulator [Myxococcales bacterium]